MMTSLTISDLRTELGQTLEEFARSIGLNSKGHASEVERTGRASLRVALAIEVLSGGRIDAADLNDDVMASRAGLSHDCADTAPTNITSPGKSNDLTAQGLGA